MKKFASSIAAAAVISLGMMGAASAQFGMPSLPGGGSLPIPGVGGGGGFSSAAASLTTNLKSALYNQVMAIALIQEAQGDKAKASQIRATAAQIEAMKQPSKDALEKSLKAVEQNPVNREGLAKVRDEEGKKKVAEAQGHMNIALVYNGLAIASATAMIATKPGPSDLVNAPAILDAAQMTLTAIPTQTSNIKKYNEATEAFMKENNVPKLSSSQKAAIAKKTDPQAASKAAQF